MAADAERVARTEVRFRDINERLEGDLERLSGPGEPLRLVCECGSPSCRETVMVTVDEYEAIRQDSRRFVVVPGHNIPVVEQRVHAEDRFEVVEKQGVAARIAERADARAGR